MSASTRFSGTGGYPLRPVASDSPGVERAVSATSVVELAGEPSQDREVRIRPDGTITASAPTEEHFTEALSYGARMAALVGELLGMEGLSSLDLHFKNSRWGVVLLPDGDVVAKQVAGTEEFKTFKGRFDRSA
jgi:hypothetical protein